MRGKMETSLINVVILASDYEMLISWYLKVFNLEIYLQVKEGYDYTELGQSNRLIVGIAKTEEMGLVPTKPRNNSVIIQIAVSSLDKIFDTVSKSGGKVLFGPSIDEKEGFVYGGIADPEGNQIWIVEKDASY